MRNFGSSIGTRSGAWWTARSMSADFTMGAPGIFTRSTIAWVWLRPRTTLAYVSSRIHKLSDCSSASRPSAVTQSGRVTADFVVLAGNAYLGELAPSIQSRVMPVGTYIGATTQLGDNRAKALNP